jgi:hypothetical protein
VANPRRALRVLHTLVEGGNWGLLESVAISTQTLLEAGQADAVLDALLDWTESYVDEEAQVKALRIFAFAVTPEDTVDQPLLMRTAEHNPVLPRLWGRALANREVRDFALNALRSWLRFVDRDGTGQKTVLHLLADIGDDDRANLPRLMLALEKWASDPNDPSTSALLFHERLEEVQ